MNTHLQEQYNNFSTIKWFQGGIALRVSLACSSSQSRSSFGSFDPDCWDALSTCPSGAGSLLPAGPRRRDWGFWNGDPYYEARRIVINQKRVANFETLLREVTGGIQAPFGAVRNIYTPRGGHKVDCLDSLQSGEQYVAAGRERFKKMDYQQIGSRKKNRLQSLPMQARPLPQNRLTVSPRFLKPIKEPCTIFVVANGDILNPAMRLLIQQRILCQFDRILEMITEKMGLRVLGGVRSLYTYEGHQVTDGSQLESGQLYVAVGREKFKRLAYSDLLFTKPRGTRRVNGILTQVYTEMKGYSLPPIYRSPKQNGNSKSTTRCSENGDGDSKASPPDHNGNSKEHLVSLVREISQARLMSLRKMRSGQSMTLDVTDNGNADDLDSKADDGNTDDKPPQDQPVDENPAEEGEKQEVADESTTEDTKEENEETNGEEQGGEEKENDEQNDEREEEATGGTLRLLADMVSMDLAGFTGELKIGSTIYCQSGRYVIQDFIGEGSFGKVAKCLNLLNNETVAIKIHKSHLSNADIHQEVDMLQQISTLDPDQNNLVEFIDAFDCENCYCLAFEMLDKSLWDLMKERHFQPLTLNEIRPITQQVLKAFNALKGLGIMHTDVKVDNIMLVNHQDQPFKVKLIDFGLALPVRKAKVGMTLQAPSFRAPEVFLGLPISEAIDMWGLGCVIAFLYFGNYLFPGDASYEEMKAICQMLEEALVTEGAGS
uniref:doublecortin domain-containing protein 2-like n=1 Tax=Monopterus albus TaxID=43700 RepID=UPI0009B48FE7|nr:doublecortin domain-containing protein 2-like [Monopterus albus]